MVAQGVKSDRAPRRCPTPLREARATIEAWFDASRSDTMAEKFKAGEATEWNSHGNMGRGKVKRKLTQRTLIKGHTVDGAQRASASDEAYPDYDAREPQQLIDPAEQSDG